MPRALPPVLRLSLVHPQQAVAHRHVVVGRPEIRRPPELAVPRVRVFVREQVAVLRMPRPLREVFGHGGVLAGAVMLKADTAHLVGQREQKVIVVVMVRAEQLVSLLYQRLVCLQGTRAWRQSVPAGRRRL